MLFKTFTPALPLEVGWLNQSIVNREVIPNLASEYSCVSLYACGLSGGWIPATCVEQGQ